VVQLLLEILMMVLQVECTPPGNIQFRISDFRNALGGYIKLAVFDVAGSASVSKVELKSSSQAVSSPLGRFHKMCDSSSTCFVELLQVQDLECHLGVQDSAYFPLVRTFGATYEGSNLPELPLDVRITNNLGQQVVAR
jgi:hypothetical protein